MSVLPTIEYGHAVIETDGGFFPEYETPAVWFCDDILEDDYSEESSP